MPRGKRWDSLTLGPARRRRHMHRQLAALDRWYAEQAAPTYRGGDGRRRFLVATVTVVIALLATGHLLHKQGFTLGIDGVHERRGEGPSTTLPGSDAYRFVAHQPGRPDDPVTYDPCSTIHLVVNDTLAPAGSARILAKASAAVASATGLRLVVDGRTDEAPTRDRPLRDPVRYGRGWSPVLVAWTTPAQVPGLKGRPAGLGGSARVVDEMSGRSTYVHRHSGARHPGAHHDPESSRRGGRGARDRDARARARGRACPRG